MLKLEDFLERSGEPGFRGRCSERLLGSVIQSKAVLKWVISIEEREFANSSEMCFCT